MDGNALNTLWSSTESFHRRFESFPPEEDSALAVFLEEVREVEDAVLKGDDNNLCHESADVIVTLMGILMSRGITYDMFIAEILRVVEKNDSKTWRTHYINDNGKIQRIGRK